MSHGRGWSVIRANSSADTHGCIVIDCSASVCDGVLPGRHTPTAARLQVICFICCFVYSLWLNGDVPLMLDCILGKSYQHFPKFFVEMFTCVCFT